MLVYAVDDEKAARYFLESALKQVLPEAEILTFDNPLKLLDAFTKRRPDVCFLDIEMPEINGIELAKALIDIQERTNIIFVTGYTEYAYEAMNVYASGYVLKPCNPEEIKKALSKLRYAPEVEKDIVVKTFGNFDVFYKGVPVKFRSPKSKELLAYLVDREGALVSRMEMAGILYEDDFSRNTQTQLSHTAKRLLEDLEAAGIKDFFFIDAGYRIDLSKADCDMVDYLSGKGKHPFTGEYMEQYSWGEYRKGSFEK